MLEAAGQYLSCWESEVLLLGRVFKSESDLVLKFLLPMRPLCTKLCCIWLCSIWLPCGKLCCTWFWCLFPGRIYLVCLSVLILIVCLFDRFGLLSQIVRLLSWIAPVGQIMFLKLCCISWNSISTIFLVAGGGEWQVGIVYPVHHVFRVFCVSCLFQLILRKANVCSLCKCVNRIIVCLVFWLIVCSVCFGSK